MILNPGEYFTVVRELADPNDSSTYYVQAKIRNARTGTLLKTLNLTDQTGQLFTGQYQVPADPSGLGFYISIVTRVYTDAAYTSLSDSYGQEASTYLVDNRFRNLGGGGGGDSINYKKIRTIFRDELSGFEFPSLDLDPVLSALKNWTGLRDALLSILKKVNTRTEKIATDVEGLQSLKNKEPDFSSVITAVEAIPGKVKIPEKDDTQILEAISTLRTDLNAGPLKDLLSAAEGLQSLFDSADFKKQMASMPEVSGSVEKIKSEIKDFLYVIATKKPEEPAPVAPKLPDYIGMATKLVRKK